MIAGFAFGFGMMIGAAVGVVALVVLWCWLDKLFNGKA